mmetsp:Transcript_30524/g.58776  ORF Transcript_30524/g.58776 Transcript_30524/m.58776 type:complete len:753 (-) Transcript_30524:423-2681(-)
MGRHTLVTLGAVAVAILTGAVQFFDQETLHGPFLLDDRGTVTQNPCVKPEIPGSWERLWTYDYWCHQKLTDKDSHKSFRPITTLTFRWNYSFHGLDTFGYRVTNIAMHAVVCGLSVLAVVRSMVYPRLLEAFAAAIVFAVHPVHAEAVSNITGRAEVLSALLYLCGFLCYTTAHVRLPSGSWRPSNVLRFCLAYAALMAFTVLALLSKEHGITLPVMCAGWDAVTASGLSMRALVFGWSRHYTAEQRGRWRGWAARTCVLAASTLAVAYWRLSLNGETEPKFIKEQNPAAYADSRMERGLSYSWLYIRNLGLLVIPTQLSPDWTGGIIPNVESLSDWRVVPIACLYASLLAWLVWIMSPPTRAEDADDKLRKRASEILEILKRDSVMMMAWLIIPFFMSMNLVTTVGFVMADRVLYLSTLGYSMCLVTLPHVVSTVQSAQAAGKKESPEKPKDQDQGNQEAAAAVSDSPFKVAAALVLLVAGCYSVKCYHQNRTWRSEFSLWESCYKINPVGFLAVSEYGKSLANVQRYNEAVEVLKMALSSTPDHLTVMGSLGLSYVYTGRCEEAMPLFQTGLNYALTGVGMSDTLQEEFDPQKQVSMAAIFYVGLSHCAPNLHSMAQLAFTAIQTHPESSFALEHAEKVNGYLTAIKKEGLEPHQVLVFNSQGQDGNRQMDFKIDPLAVKPGPGESSAGMGAGFTHQAPKSRASSNGATATPKSKPNASRAGVKKPKTRQFDDPILNAHLFQLERMSIDI